MLGTQLVSWKSFKHLQLLGHLGEVLGYACLRVCVFMCVRVIRNQTGLIELAGLAWQLVPWMLCLCCHSLCLCAADVSSDPTFISTIYMSPAGILGQLVKETSQDEFQALEPLKDWALIAFLDTFLLLNNNTFAKPKILAG